MFPDEDQDLLLEGIWSDTFI